MFLALITNIFNLKVRYFTLIILLLTAIIEKTSAKIDEISKDSTFEKKEKTNNFLEDEIIKDAKDSINIDIENKKIFLYGSAKIEYLDIKIESGFIEIDWKTNIITAKPKLDSLGEKYVDQKKIEYINPYRAMKKNIINIHFYFLI